MDFLKKLFQKEIVRYVVAGGCTTLVNLVSFGLLRLLTDLSRSQANIIAITLAIIFAFFANKHFVFESHSKNTWHYLVEFCSFVGARILSMLVEVIGTNLLCDSFRYNEFISKIVIQAVVLVINYIFGKCFVFKKGEKRSFKDKIKNNLILILSFGIPAVFMFIMWIVGKIGPFGGNSLTFVDSLHQYLPFFSEYYDKLKGEGSLFYSWDIGLGSNFLAVITYYMSSPLNFIIVLFKKEHIYIIMSLLISLKICFSSFSMAYYLEHRFGRKNDVRVLIFALAFALSNYMLGYSWNLMWMDVVMMLPLVMTGFYQMIEDGRYKLYTLALFYILLCNYFIAFMVCIFLVLQFLLTRHKGVKRFFADSIKFAGASLMAAAMASFILIPAYLAINTTAAATREFPESSWYGSMWDILKQSLFLTKPIKSQVFDGGINLYCGTICLILVVVYLLNKEVKLWDKIKNIILVALLLISFNNVLLNYIWHGFHDQYGIPNRFSFLFIFILLEISYEALLKLKSTHPVCLMAAIVFAYIYLIYMRQEVSISKETMVGTALFIGAYGVFMIYIRGVRSNIGRYLLIALTILCLSETMTNAARGYYEMGNVNMSYYFTDEEYIEQAIEEARIDEDTHRAELMNSTVVDESIYYNLKSVSIFGSTVSGELVDTMHKLGYYTAANEFLFDGGNTVTNMLLGVKYLIKRDGDVNRWDVNPDYYNDNVTVYRNEYALSYGYMVDDALSDWQGNGTNMFESINEFMELATGVTGTFTMLYPNVTWASENCIIENNDTLSYWYDYTRTDSSECDFSLSFEITDESSDCYIIANCTGVTKIAVFVDGNQVEYDRLQNQTYHVGHLTRGQTVTVKYFFPSTQSNTGSAKLVVASLNWDCFLQEYEYLKANQLDIQNFDDGYILGTIDARDGGLLFTSVPYDKGYTVYVDGKETEYNSVNGGFIAVKLSPGEHEIEMIYYPPGLNIGMLLTLAGWFIFTFLMVLSGKRKNLLLKSDDSH